MLLFRINKLIKICFALIIFGFNLTTRHPIRKRNLCFNDPDPVPQEIGCDDIDEVDANERIPDYIKKKNRKRSRAIEIGRYAWLTHFCCTMRN